MHSGNPVQTSVLPVVCAITLLTNIQQNDVNERRFRVDDADKYLTSYNVSLFTMSILNSFVSN